MPQAFTHGTLACNDDQVSSRFYADVLGLRTIQAYRGVVYIKHPEQRHYVVCLKRPSDNHFSPNFRYTLTVESTDAVQQACDELKRLGTEAGIRELCPIESSADHASFLLLDLDTNWWEISSPRA